MQGQRHFSLNAVRVFEVAARHGSLKLAAVELSVTPSAVSHQIKSLEEALGVTLFERRNNAVLLTAAGRQFLEDIAPAVATIERAAEALRRSASEVVLRAGVSLAVRWLIPKLEDFKRRYPQIRIRLETTHLPAVPLGPDVDLAISYSRKVAVSRSPKLEAGGIVLMKDICRPVLSPALLAKSGYERLADISLVPILSATEDDWDWRAWSGSDEVRHRLGDEADRIDFKAIRVRDRFDTDDAAIHGAVAGIGMVLMPPVMTQKEIEIGSLVELPEAPAVQLGSFHVTTTPRPRPVVEKFRKWLLAQQSAL